MSTSKKTPKEKLVFDKGNNLRKKNTLLKKDLTELHQKLDRTEFEAKLLREINSALTSTFELKEILALILQVLTTLVNTEVSSVILVNESDNTLRIAESCGLNAKNTENFYIYYAQLDNTIFREVMKKSTPTFFTADDELSIPLMMSVPLISRNKVIGFLNVHSMYRNNRLTSDKVALVNALASQASIAINNAQLFNTLKEQATQDQCTNLFNFRYFHQKLEEEIGKADKNNTTISLMILDIDFFKKVNDTYGHLYGDQVLHELGKILKRNVRSEDTVCRYGGEEFAIIFPNCNQEVAEGIAERIRKKIEDTTANDRRNVFKDRITVSIGVADFQKGLDKTTLVQRADSCLYYAKNTGRNRVCGYDPNLESEYKKYLPKSS